MAGGPVVRMRSSPEMTTGRSQTKMGISPAKSFRIMTTSEIRVPCRGLFPFQVHVHHGPFPLIPAPDRLLLLRSRTFGTTRFLFLVQSCPSSNPQHFFPSFQSLVAGLD